MLDGKYGLPQPVHALRRLARALIGDHVTNTAEAAHSSAQGHRIGRPFRNRTAPA
ncbi:MAG TPA: hypothetical protein VMA30_03410 [Xanthobacteraceae bacterium]|nr:hypothetical protein [Xanthobacteraceae bacterium]